MRGHGWMPGCLAPRDLTLSPWWPSKAGADLWKGQGLWEWPGSLGMAEVSGNNTRVGRMSRATPGRGPRGGGSAWNPRLSDRRGT